MKKMKTYEALHRYLIDKGVRRDSIRVNLMPKDNTYCIHNIGNEVEVFYSERGLKIDLRIFNTDKEAIEFFKELVLSDESVFNK